MPGHVEIDRQYAPQEFGNDVSVQPLAEDISLHRVTSFHLQHANLEFHHRDRRQKKFRRNDGTKPLHKMRVGLAIPSLSQFGNDIGVENEHQEKSAGLISISIRGGSNSTSPTPGGMPRISMMSPFLPAKRRYSSIVSST